MPSDSFSDLLTLYMRRIRASAAGVAAEIGLSREAVNNWRNGMSAPSARSRDHLVACTQYLRLTEHEANRLLQAAGLDPQYPLQAESRGPSPFGHFLDQLFVQLTQAVPYPITMLLSPAHWGQPPFRQDILARSRAQYGDDAVLHIQPPYSAGTSSIEYFSALGRQCGLEDVSTDYEFEAALERRLSHGKRLFCLVSRFEQGTPALREALAGILRSLSEMHSGRLHLLLCGGEALADLKYRSGDLSLLNIAQVKHWPDPTLADLTLLAQQRWPEVTWPAQVMAALHEVAGGHPALIEEGLRWLVDHGVTEDKVRSPALHMTLAGSARIWQSFLSLSQKPEGRVRLESLLRSDDLGRASPYLQDTELRNLFWANLIHERETVQGPRLYWRSKAIRDAGLMVLDT